MTKFNIAYINQCTQSEGIGKRMAIWFQGCNINCVGCCNKKLQTFEPKHIIEFDSLKAIISEANSLYEIEGVTLLGGEPIMQQGLSELCKYIQSIDLSVILFTGMQYEDLTSELLENIDIVIDGKFEIDKIDASRNMIGSTNQRIICVSEKYKDKLDWFNVKREKHVEINFSKSGLFRNGDVLN